MNRAKAIVPPEVWMALTILPSDAAPASEANYAAPLAIPAAGTGRLQVIIVQDEPFVGPRALRAANIEMGTSIKHRITVRSQSVLIGCMQGILLNAWGEMKRMIWRL